MPKKGGGKKGKKGKKGPEDWGALPRDRWVMLEVRNSLWQSLRFTHLMKTSENIHTLVDLIRARHNIASVSDLNLYLGEGADEAAQLRPEEYGLSLADVKVPGGSVNDHILQVVTYEYAPHKTTTLPTIPPSQNFGILHLPQVAVAPLRRYGPC